MKIFQGPPGTGKTYQAAREATRIVDGSVDADPSKFLKRHKTLQMTGRIVWVTFHPSYSYEDFVEGFRPVQLDATHIGYAVVDGPFKIACENCTKLNPLTGIHIADRLGQGGRYEVIDVDSGGVALKSKVDRQDAVTPEIVQYADLWTIKRLRDSGIQPSQLSVAGKHYGERADLARATMFPTTFGANSSHYRALYERIYPGSTSAAQEPVVLVIDELNRADLSRVFGELMTLIEIDKRQGAPEERSVLLPYSQNLLSVPLMLSIVGTMNTADRSLAVVDLALRRRFEFVSLSPEPGLCPTGYGDINVGDLLTRWNRRITALLSPDSQIGHAELMEVRVDQVRVANSWPADSDGRRRALASTMRRKVLPLLLEYFHDDWLKAEVVLGNRGLLERVEFEDVAKLAADILDLTDYSGFIIPAWWDPEDSARWDGDRFRKAITESA
jgi:5-methylcytosine-specific restriction protein B